MLCLTHWSLGDPGAIHKMISRYQSVKQDQKLYLYTITAYLSTDLPGTNELNFNAMLDVLVLCSSYVTWMYFYDLDACDRLLSTVYP